MMQWGEDYADLVIQNAKTLAETLSKEGIPVVGNGNKFTESHTVLINTKTLGSSKSLGYRLQEAGIITTLIKLPDNLGGNGLRLGTNELTRHGARKQYMQEVAHQISDLLFERATIEQVNKKVISLSKELDSYTFTWST
jgi:glycine hydroxymethyltransferase